MLSVNFKLHETSCDEYDTHLPFSVLYIIKCLYFQIETIYKKAHSAIRADPVYKKKPAKKVTKKRWNQVKLTLEQRKTKIAAHKADFLAKLKADAE